MSDGPLTPDELKTLLTSLEAAAEVVEAIDVPALQSLRGWDLRGWNYVLVPWGVRFAHKDFAEKIDVRIEAFVKRRGNSGEPEA